MVRGYRRDQWDRAGQLLALVHNRTRFGEKEQPANPTDFWPPGLIHDAEKQKPQQIQKTTLSAILDRVLPVR